MKIACAAAFIFCAVIAAGTMDQQDQEIEQAHYCEMVKSGAWPNFKNINCKEI